MEWKRNSGRCANVEEEERIRGWNIPKLGEKLGRLEGGKKNRKREKYKERKRWNGWIKNTERTD